MRKFKFRLQSVMDHREAIEDKLLGELTELRHKEQEELKHLDDLGHERERLCLSIAQGKYPPSQLKDADSYLCALCDDIKVQQLTLEAVQKQVAEKLAEVIEASKERKLIEKLKEKHLQEYQREMFALEQKALDDNASVRFARNSA